MHPSSLSSKIANDGTDSLSSQLLKLRRGWEFLRTAADDTVQRAANAPLLHPRCCTADRGNG